MNDWLPWFFVGLGALTLLAGVIDLDFVFGGPRAPILVRVLGRTAARVVYALGGVVLIAIGCLVLTGVFVLR